MKVGLLTGGGDCPGLNAVIRAVVQQVANEGGSCVGVLEGWRGLVQDMSCALSTAQTDGIIGQGGSILGSSRTNPYRNPETDLAALRENFRRLELDALVVIGGDDTLGVALRLHNDFGFPVVGVPKTIDNDLLVTDFSFGFDTAVNIVTEAVDRLRTTTESHRRIVVVETMGRHSGWIACFAGIAAGADYILVPEVPIDLPHLISVLTRRRLAGKKYGIVIVAEGARFPDRGPLTLDDPPDPFGNPRLGGIGWADRRCDREANPARDALRRARTPPARRAAERLRSNPGHSVGARRQPARPSTSLRHPGNRHQWPDRGNGPERGHRRLEDAGPDLLR